MSFSPSDQKRINNILGNLHQAERQFAGLELGSHYMNESIPPNDKIKESPDIRMLIKRYRDDLEKIQKVKRIPDRSVPHLPRRKKSLF